MYGGCNKMVEREYDYIRGNTVLTPKREYNEIDKRIEREKQERRQRELQRKEKEAKKATVKSILQVSCIALILGVSTIARDGKVYRMQNDLSKVKSEIKTVTAEGEALRVNLLRYSSLADIKDIANESGMKIPEKNDSVEVDLTKNFFANLGE